MKYFRDFEFFKGLAKHGSKHVRELFLRPSIAGDQVACLGVSEPGAGSDVAQVFSVFQNSRNLTYFCSDISKLIHFLRLKLLQNLMVTTMSSTVLNSG